MKPVFQTRFGAENAPPEQQGNCMAACVASLLELSLEDVPDFRPDTWWLTLVEWLRARGLDAFYVEIPHERAREVQPSAYVSPGTYYIGGGLTARGTGHVCVYFADRMVHDPLPGGRGLDLVDSYLFIAPRMAS